MVGSEPKQARDNINGADVVTAFDAFHRSPRAGAVYNLGGGRHSNCSMLEAIEASERIAGRPLSWTLEDEPRMGDHRWWISDFSSFRRDYPAWSPGHDIDSILRDIHERNADRWLATVRRRRAPRHVDIVDTWNANAVRLPHPAWYAFEGEPCEM